MDRVGEKFFRGPGTKYNTQIWTDLQGIAKWQIPEFEPFLMEQKIIVRNAPECISSDSAGTKKFTDLQPYG